MWLSGLSAQLRSKGSLVGFPVRAHAWVAGRVPRRGAREAPHIGFLSLSFSLPSPFIKINKILKKKIYLSPIIMVIVLRSDIFNHLVTELFL